MTNPAVVFDDTVSTDERNIRSNRATDQSPGNPDKVGQTNFGNWSHDLGDYSGIVAEDYGTVGGGAGNYCYGIAATIVGGVRNDARGYCAVAGGYRCFANGEGCVAFGHTTVAGRPPDDPVGERKFAVCLGSSSFASATSCFAQGGNNNIDYKASYACAIGFNHAIGNDTYESIAGVALGWSNQVQSPGSGAVAIGQANTSRAAGSVAMGGACETELDSDYSVALGWASKTAGPGAVAQGHACLATAQGAVALGEYSEARALGSVALGQYAKATRYGQLSIAAGKFVEVGDSQTCKMDLRGLSDDGAECNLLDINGNFLTLENGKGYVILSTFMGIRTDAVGFASWVRRIHCYCTGSEIQITQIDVVSNNENSTGWTFEISALGTALVQQATGTAGQEVNFFVSNAWAELGGGPV